MIRKNIQKVALIALLMTLIGCGGASSNKNKTNENNMAERTKETENLLKNLLKQPQQGFMFGHQDDPMYGIGWDGDADRSDVKSIVGDYPAVMGFDLGHLELGNSENLDKVPFDKMREQIILQYKRGGVITISWHLDNPLTGGNTWDVTRKGVVTSILPNGENHEKFMGWLQRVADFLATLQTDDGTKIPIIFRPWHEHTGSWFWWGRDLCTPDEFRQLWHMTVDFMKEKGLNNLLYAYSPHDVPNITDIFMEAYPGDDYVDIIGYDIYHTHGPDGVKNYQTGLDAVLALMTEEGKNRKKPIAITETGLEALPIADWWTKVLLPVVDKYPLAYVLVWRNARDRTNHFYAPYPEQISEADFKLFFENPKTIFCNELHQIYR